MSLSCQRNIKICKIYALTIIALIFIVLTIVAYVNWFYEIKTLLLLYLLRTYQACNRNKHKRHNSVVPQCIYIHILRQVLLNVRWDFRDTSFNCSFSSSRNIRLTSALEVFKTVRDNLFITSRFNVFKFMFSDLL